MSLEDTVKEEGIKLDPVRISDVKSTAKIDETIRTSVFWDFSSTNYQSQSLFAQRDRALDEIAKDGAAVAIDTLVQQHYTAFDIAEAARLFKKDLENALYAHAKIDPSKQEVHATTIVVDPDKHRKNILSLWEYDGRDVYIAHPDTGQVTELLDNPDWHLQGAVEISHDKISDSYKRDLEKHMKWDGQATYLPISAWAAYARDISQFGEQVNQLRRISESGTHYQGIKNTRTSSEHAERPKRDVGHHAILYITPDSETYDRFVEDLDLPDNTITHIVSNPGSKTLEQAITSLDFAAINSFYDTEKLSKTIVYDDGEDHEEYVRLRPNLPEGDADITLIAPNNKALSLVYNNFDGSEYEIVKGDLQDIIYGGGEATDRDLETDDRFRTERVDDDTIEGFLYEWDGNGNFLTGINPGKHSINVNDYDSVRLSVEDEDGWREIGNFRSQDNYDRFDADGPYSIDTPDKKEPIANSLNPALPAGNGHTSDRAKLEFFIPYGALREVMDTVHSDLDLHVGTRVRAEFLRDTA